MKKILFSFVALVASMSINAQNAKVMRVLDGETVLNTYDVKPTLKVVFDDAPAYGTGTAKRTGDIDVKWIQLWKDGPKFAEYNVGAASNKAEDYGGYYCWGKSIDKDPTGTYKTGSNPLAGEDDTATNLWGSAWRMPTQAELQALRDNCDVTWTTVGGKYGRKFTGKEEPYKSNSIFLPAAGFCGSGNVGEQGIYGNYWSSTPEESNKAYYLGLGSDILEVFSDVRSYGASVRPVLKE